MMHGAQRSIAAVLDCSKPVVAVVQGPAAGLGATSRSCATWSLHRTRPTSSSRSCSAASWSMPAARTCFPASVGLQRAKELAFLGDKLPAADAKDLGLVNRFGRRRNWTR